MLVNIFIKSDLDPSTFILRSAVNQLNGYQLSHKAESILCQNYYIMKTPNAEMSRIESENTWFIFTHADLLII